MKTTVGSRFSSHKTSQEQTMHNAGSSFNVMALKTIGGSAVPSKNREKTCGKQHDAKGVQIERSWKVELNSRSILFPDDGESEEHILGSTGVAQFESPDLERQN